MRRVAVTGANGFIGRHVCARLAAAGDAVVAVMRRAEDSREVASECRIVPDPFVPGALAEAFAGCDAVVHLAGRAHVQGGDAADAGVDFARANAQLALRSVEGAAHAGATTFVYVSSVAAAAGPAAGAVSPHDAPRPSTAYGVSKLAAEDALFAAAPRLGLASYVVRPPMVYGEGMKGNPLRLFRLIDRGIPLPLGAVNNARSMLYVGNLADALAAVVAHSGPLRAPSLPHYVTDGEPLSTVDLVRRSARALGRPARVPRVPESGLRAAAAVGELFARVAPVPLTVSTLESLIGTLVVDDTSFRTTFGWSPPYAVDAALARTARWFLDRRPAGT